MRSKEKLGASQEDGKKVYREIDGDRLQKRCGHPQRGVCCTAVLQPKLGPHATMHEFTWYTSYAGSIVHAQLSPNLISSGSPMCRKSSWVTPDRVIPKVLGVCLE